MMLSLFFAAASGTVYDYEVTAFHIGSSPIFFLTFYAVQQVDFGAIANNNSQEVCWTNGGAMNTSFAKLASGDTLIIPGGKTFHLMVASPLHEYISLFNNNILPLSYGTNLFIITNLT